MLRRTLALLALVAVTACGSLLRSSDDDEPRTPSAAPADAAPGDADGSPPANADGAVNADAGAGVDASSATEKVVFVTAGAWTGALGGLAGADAKCQKEADEAGLAGVFVAYLALPNVAAASRLPNAGRWVNVAGTVVFEGAPGAVLPRVPLDVTAAGMKTTTIWAWTGVSDVPASYCGDWESDASIVNGGFGRPTEISSEWQSGGNTVSSCGNSAALYCFES